MDDATDGAEPQGSGSGLNLDLARSYLAFAKRGILAHRVLGSCVAIVGIVLSVLVARYIPRTYICSTVLMTVETTVLDGDRGPRPLAGAEGLIMRRENLESLIKDSNLMDKYFVRRPPLLQLKDRITQRLFGKMDKKTLLAVLVATVESRLTVEIEPRQQRDTLAITVAWGDPDTAAELTEATKQGFLRIRHAAEISAFQEKMAILDIHASRMREEVSALAEQLNAAASAKVVAAVKREGAPKDFRPTSAPSMLAKPKSVVDEQLPVLRERLADLKQKLAAAEGDRTSRINAERAKLEELKLHLTPSHPQVITQEERVGLVSNVSAELAMLRSEVADVQMQIHQRDAMVTTGQALPRLAGAASASAGASAGGEPAEMLPAEVLRLLAEEEGDPALRAQLSGAIVRYGGLRDDVRASRLALDTAQAAFNHRYQVVVPVETPSAPSKPNIAGIYGIGIVLSLLLGLLVPILLELRRGIMVETWQVAAFQLPILAELRLPQRRED